MQANNKLDNTKLKSIYENIKNKFTKNKAFISAKDLGVILDTAKIDKKAFLTASNDIFAKSKTERYKTITELVQKGISPLNIESNKIDISKKDIEKAISQINKKIPQQQEKPNTTTGTTTTTPAKITTGQINQKQLNNNIANLIKNNDIIHIHEAAICAEGMYYSDCGLLLKNSFAEFKKAGLTHFIYAENVHGNNNSYNTMAKEAKKYGITVIKISADEQNINNKSIASINKIKGSVSNAKILNLAVKSCDEKNDKLNNVICKKINGLKSTDIILKQKDELTNILWEKSKQNDLHYISATNIIVQ